MQSNYLIVSLRRCGSTFLSSELDSYDDFYCQWDYVMRPVELLKPVHKLITKEEFSFIDAFKTFKTKAKFIGSKMTIPDYQSRNDIEIMLDYIKRKPIHVIHITRPLHEQFISLMYAKSTGVWQVLSDKNETRSEYLRDVKEVIPHNETQKLKQISLSINEVESFCRVF